MRGLLARARDVFLRRRADEEMDEELRFHIDMETDRNVAAGMSETEARRVALAHFGGVERYRQRLRDGRTAPIVEPLARDLRVGFRAVRRSPGFSLVAVLTVALGVGATSAVFSIVNTFLFRPLSLPGIEGLVTVDEQRRGAMSSGLEGWRIPFSRYRSYADRTEDVFAGLAGRRFGSFAVRLDDRTVAWTAR